MKKFLLITYYWPPCGGVPVQRWLKLTKYFPLNNWLPTVLTTQDGDYPYIDETLLNEVSKDINVVRTKTLKYSEMFKSVLGKDEKIPYGSLKTSKEDTILKKIAYFTRVQFVSPDARIIWNGQAYKAAEKLLMSGMYESVITTGPPHSTHLIGLKLKNKYDINWIADFRDPWSKIHYHENEKRNLFIKSIDKQIEANVLSKANAVVTVSKRVSETLGQGKKIVIPNAFDPDDFVMHQYKKTDKFRIKFVGALFEDRKHLLLMILDWIEEYASKKGIDNIEFSLIGAFDRVPESILRRVEHIKFQNIPFIQHQNVIAECVNSELLLLVILDTKNNEGILTYKLFEYIGAKSFILGIGPAVSDAREIINQTGAGTLHHYKEKKDFLQSLDTLYNKWQKGENIKNEKDVRDYSVPTICKRYSDLLNAICGIGTQASCL